MSTGSVVDRPLLPTQVDTVLFGAGVSMPLPTRAPGGDELGLFALTALSRAARGPDSMIENRIAERLSRSQLRLEKIMQTWADTTQTRTLFKAYELLGPLPPNEDHARLALLARESGAALLTLNIDTCVEHAAELLDVGLPAVIHLHGVWNDPASIMTTIADYDDGLPPELRAIAAASFADKTVLVIGYSGRDTDVLPLLLEHPPADLHWVHYDPATDPSDEARALFAEARRRGQRIHLHSGETRRYLTPLLGSPSPVLPPTRETSNTRGEQLDRLIGELDDVPSSRRLIALAQCLAELGLWDEAIDTLAHVHPDDPMSSRAHKLTGRFHRQAERPWQALESFAWPPRTRRDLRHAVTCVNEALAAGVEARRPAYLLANAGVALIPSALLRSPAVARTGTLARTRMGQYVSMRGHARGAELIARPQLVADTASTFVTRASQLVYLADVIKAQGRYREALELLRPGEPRIPYLEVRGQCDYRWRYGELLHLIGDTAAAAGHMRWIVDATYRFVDERNTWHLTTALGVFADSDPVRADEVARTLHDAPATDPAVNAYRCFGLAEYALRRGAIDEANTWIERAETGLRACPPLWRYPTYSLMCRLFRARLLAYETPKQGAHEMANLVRAFSRRRMASVAARCVALRCALLGLEPPAELVDRAEREGWAAEHHLLTSPMRRAYLTVVL